MFRWLSGSSFFIRLCMNLAPTLCSRFRVYLIYSEECGSEWLYYWQTVCRHEQLVKTKLLKNIQGFTKNIQGLMGPIPCMCPVALELCICNSLSKSAELQVHIGDWEEKLRNHADEIQNVESSVRRGCNCFYTFTGKFRAYYHFIT